MNVLVAIDHHFERDPGGHVHLGPPMSIAGRHFWERYLSVFEEVVVLARVKQTEVRPAIAVPADGPGVCFQDLPDYFGPWQYARNYGALIREVQRATERADAFVLRVPGAVGQLAWQRLRRQGRPYALEVVADPWDMLSPGATRSVVRPLIRRIWSRRLRQMCREAAAICYVTERALQERYPPGPGTWSTFASDVDIGERLASPDELQERLRRYQSLSTDAIGDKCVHVGFLGALAQLYKAPDVLLRAAAICLGDGLDFDVAIAGDGQYRGMLEKMAADLRIRERTRFVGALSPGEQVWQFLDQTDLFVLPSRQEGLPRAMVEAMARACPCIGSTVGGIPELLAPENLVAPGDARHLAEKIREVLGEHARMASMSKRNWEKAREYQPAALEERRVVFYQKVRELGQRSWKTKCRVGSS